MTCAQGQRAARSVGCIWLAAHSTKRVSCAQRGCRQTTWDTRRTRVAGSWLAQPARSRVQCRKGAESLPSPRLGMTGATPLLAHHAAPLSHCRTRLASSQSVCSSVLAWRLWLAPFPHALICMLIVQYYCMPAISFGRRRRQLPRTCLGVRHTRPRAGVHVVADTVERHRQRGATCLTASPLRPGYRSRPAPSLASAVNAGLLLAWSGKHAGGLPWRPSGHLRKESARLKLTRGRSKGLDARKKKGMHHNDNVTSTSRGLGADRGAIRLGSLCRPSPCDFQLVSAPACVVCPVYVFQIHSWLACGFCVRCCLCKAMTGVRMTYIRTGCSRESNGIISHQA